MINPHTCPHPEWVNDTNMPQDREKRCIACGTVFTYIDKFYRPCCDYGSDQGIPATKPCPWDS